MSRKLSHDAHMTIARCSHDHHTLQAIGSYGAGLIDIEELHHIECSALPGSGSCGQYISQPPTHHQLLWHVMLLVCVHTGGMFTANTMSSAVEALGMALPGKEQ